jgi:hypothetical protein
VNAHGCGPLPGGMGHAGGHRTRRHSGVLAGAHYGREPAGGGLSGTQRYSAAFADHNDVYARHAEAGAFTKPSVQRGIVAAERVAAWWPWTRRPAEWGEGPLRELP